MPKRKSVGGAGATPGKSEGGDIRSMMARQPPKSRASPPDTDEEAFQRQMAEAMAVSLADKEDGSSDDADVTIIDHAEFREGSRRTEHTDDPAGSSVRRPPMESPVQQPRLGNARRKELQACGLVWSHNLEQEPSESTSSSFVLNVAGRCFPQALLLPNKDAESDITLNIAIPALEQHEWECYTLASECFVVQPSSTHEPYEVQGLCGLSPAELLSPLMIGGMSKDVFERVLHSCSLPQLRPHMGLAAPCQQLLLTAHGSSHNELERVLNAYPMPQGTSHISIKWTSHKLHNHSYDNADKRGQEHNMID